MSDSCKEKTNFISNFGIYQFKVMPLRLTNGPYTVQRLMNQVLSELDFVQCYLDELFIYFTIMKEHMSHF